MAPKKKKQTKAKVGASAEDTAQQAAAVADKLQERLAAEQELSVKNAARVQSLWLVRMRQAKTEQLKAEAVILANDSTHAFQRKGELVQALEEELEGSKIEHEAVVASHAAGVEKLVTLHTEQLNSKEQQFQSDLQEMADAFKEETRKAEVEQAEHMLELDRIATAMAAHQVAMLEAAKARFSAQREEGRSKAGEEYNILKVSMQARIQELEAALAAHYHSYQKLNGERSQIVATMTADDAASAAAIEARSRKLNGLAHSTASWRRALHANTREWEQRNGALAAEKDRLAQQYRALKRASQQLDAQQTADLKQLCMESAAREETLQQQLSLAERIVRLASMCTRMEQCSAHRQDSTRSASHEQGHHKDAKAAVPAVIQFLPLKLPAPEPGPDSSSASPKSGSSLSEEVAASVSRQQSLQACLNELSVRKAKVKHELQLLLREKQMLLGQQWLQASKEPGQIKTLTGKGRSRTAGQLLQIWGAGFVAIRA